MESEIKRAKKRERNTQEETYENAREQLEDRHIIYLIGSFGHW